MGQPTSAPRIDFSQLLRAAEGLTQWRPMLLGFLTLVAAGLLMVAGQFLAFRLGGGAGALISAFIALLVVVVVAAGFSGAGVMLMDRAKAIEPRSMVDALLFGLTCLPKFIGFSLVLLGLALGLTMVASLVYFVCKLPGIGPLLLFVAHPVLVVLTGVTFTAITWVAVPLFTPAVWDGRSFKESLSLVYAVARTRLIQVVALLLGLYVVMSVIALLLLAALFPGYGLMTGLAAAVVCPGMLGGGMSSIVGILGGMDMGGGGGHLYAGMLATGLIFGVATTLMFQVLIMGVNLVYLSATAGLDIAASQGALETHLEQAKQKAREAQERARMAAERARQAMPQAATAPVAGAVPSPAAKTAVPCPQWHEGIHADDLFCGSCGHKLK